MKKTGKGIWRHLLMNILLLFAAVFGILLLSGRENYARQLRQIDEYINELSGRTAQHLGDVLDDKRNAIISIAYLYGEAIESPEVNQEYLAELEQNTGFDRIRFVNLEGESFTSDGKIADVADRDYFIQGIQGKNGITEVIQSRFNSEKLLGVYAPVWFDGEICGVMVGFMEEQSVSDILETELFESPADTMVVMRDGTVLGRYIEDGTLEISNLGELLNEMDAEDAQRARQALRTGEKTDCVLTGENGRTVGYLVPVSGTDWLLFQMFPANAAEQIVAEVNQDEQFAMLLFALVAVWFGVQMLYLMRRKNASDHAAASRERVVSMLQNVSDDFICLIDVDLETEQEQQFRLHRGNSLGDWSQGNFDYTHSIQSFCDKVVAEEDRQRVLEATRLETLKAVLAHQPAYYLEYGAVLGGEKRWLQGRFTICQDKPYENHMLISIRDMTELNLQRIRTQTSMDLIVSAASTVYPFIMEENLTRNRAKTIYNQGIVNAGKMEHMTMEEMLTDLKKTILDPRDYTLLQETMSRAAQLRAYEAGKRSLYLRVRQLGDDGIMHWMETRNILMPDPQGEIFSISMTRCVDQEIRMTEELQQAKEAAESASRAKSTFLFNMSHDIRTPMNAIMGFSAMAEKYMDDPERVQDCLKKINLSGEHLLQLINSVLDMARIESGKVKLDIQAHHIPTVLRDMEYMFQTDAQKKQLTLTMECRVTDEIAFFDLLRINQIMLNLIGNAIKYTPEGGTVWCAVRQLSTESGQATYCFTVKDNGIGMSEQFRQHVFDAFERENTGTVSGIEGSGLGLAIVERLVAEMGGRITCESQPGKGSEFACTLMFPVGTERDLPDADEPVEAGKSMKGKRVLLVEDNALNREISREILESEGLLVDEAEDGEAAVEKVRWSNPGYYCAVLMDIQMPRLNGYDAAKEIRRLHDPQLAKVPIIAVTANAFEEDRQAALAAGMNGHISKPVTPETLRQALAQFL